MQQVLHCGVGQWADTFFIVFLRISDGELTTTSRRCVAAFVAAITSLCICRLFFLGKGLRTATPPAEPFTENPSNHLKPAKVNYKFRNALQFRIPKCTPIPNCKRHKTPNSELSELTLAKVHCRGYVSWEGLGFRVCLGVSENRGP